MTLPFRKLAASDITTSSTGRSTSSPSTTGVASCSYRFYQPTCGHRSRVIGFASRLITAPA
eukprot:scaffold1211_cov169-Amphora_coffeaeformis.AAC.11